MERKGDVKKSKRKRKILKKREMEAKDEKKERKVKKINFASVLNVPKQGISLISTFYGALVYLLTERFLHPS